MTTTASISVERFKTQAKRLREFLAKSGTDISHSAGLEAVAAIHGFKDWNVASAMAKDELKLFIVCCSFSTPDEGDRMGEFQYLLRAPSAEEVEVVCRLKFSDLLGKMDSFVTGTWINVHYVIEVDEVADGGVMINWASLKGFEDSNTVGHGRIGSPLPLGATGNKLKVFGFTDYEPSESNDNPPFVKL